MNGEDTSPQLVRVEFKPAHEQRTGWVLREAKVDGHVLRVAAREKDRKGLEKLVNDFRIGFGSVSVADQAQQESDFDDVVDVVAEAGRRRGIAGVVGIEIDRIRDPDPGRMTTYMIDPDIDNDWLHIYLDGGTEASVSIDKHDTPNGKVRVHRIGDASHLVSTAWGGSAKGEFRVKGEHSPSSHYDKTGLGTVSKKRHA
jgi:hypothetical protein